MIGKVFKKYGETDSKKGLQVLREQISGQMEAAKNAANARQEYENNKNEEEK